MNIDVAAWLSTGIEIKFLVSCSLSISSGYNKKSSFQWFSIAALLFFSPSNFCRYYLLQHKKHNIHGEIADDLSSL